MYWPLMNAGINSFILSSCYQYVRISASKMKLSYLRKCTWYSRTLFSHNRLDNHTHTLGQRTHLQKKLKLIKKSRETFIVFARCSFAVI